MANREILSSRTETLNKYLKLDQKGKIMAEYVWIDSTGETRSKSRVSFSNIFPYLDPCHRQLHCASQNACKSKTPRLVPLPRHLSGRQFGQGGRLGLGEWKQS